MEGREKEEKNIFRNEFVGAGRGYCFLTAGVQQSTKAGGRGPFFPLFQKGGGWEFLELTSALFIFTILLKAEL